MIGLYSSFQNDIRIVCVCVCVHVRVVCNVCVWGVVYAYGACVCAVCVCVFMRCVCGVCM